jgi:hypothetical protein
MENISSSPPPPQRRPKPVSLNCSHPNPPQPAHEAGDRLLNIASYERAVLPNPRAATASVKPSRGGRDGSV